MKAYRHADHYYLLGILILSGIVLVYLSRAIFDGILGAVLFYAMCRSTYLHFTEEKKWRPIPASLLVMFVSFILIVLPFVSLSWIMYQKVLHFQEHPEDLKVVQERIWPLIQKFSTDKKDLNEILMTTQSKIFSLLSDALGIMSNILLQLAIMYVTLYFMFKDHKRMEEVIIKYLPLKQYQVERLGKELVNITYSNLLGQGFICFVQGLLLALGFIIFGIKDPFFWGMVCFFICFLPFIGAPLVFLPAAVLEISAGRTGAGIGIIIWGILLVSTIDNVVRFYLSKKIGDVHPLITILGVVLGLPTFGVLGLVYGPLLLSYFLLLVKFWVDTNKVR